MRAFPVRLCPTAIRFVFVCLFALVGAGAAFAQAQSNASDLQGYVRDAQGGLVVNANVTARNKATGLSRSSQTNDEGFYQITNLPPGEYEVSVEAANFSRANIPSIVLTVGQRADLDVPLAAGQVSETVTISGATTDIVETSRTVVANTIESQRIENLPVNQRDYLGIATTISTVNRGNDRPIGPAPSSGLNVGGQRGRSTLVQVDGADNTDNSINASRTTVSQEAVQEFQVATNSYAPEFGRATGGIVNVVTKSGGNEFRGNVFGFIRHKSFQARNAFAPIEDPPFTRVQYGATIGGPIKRDRTFFFAAFEQRRRQESAFFSSDVGRGLTSSLSVGPGTSFPFIPLPNTFTNLTAAQATFIANQLNTGAATGNSALIGAALTYATFASSGGQIGLNGVSTLRSIGGAIPAGQTIGGRFFISGAPVPTAANNGAFTGFTTINEAGQPIGFRPLNSLARIFPISEATSFFSTRVDHQINQSNQLTMRFGYNPGDLTGVQDESQNQVLGQNDFSRTGRQEIRDTNFVTSLTSTLTSRVVNEARFSFSNRDAKFDSQVPGTAIQISGTAFIGSNPFSPVDRTERRFQLTDNVSWLPGTHNFKFGADFNFIDVDAVFELNFPGLFNFGEVSGGTLAAGFIPGLPTSAPALTPVQAYGAGIPGVFIQGFGNPNSSLKNKPLAFFAQDSWKARPNLTLNYGVRYDVELTETIPTIGFTDPLSHINLSAADLNAAQNVLGVQQGFPRDTNNFAPRVGLAWDLTNDGKTVFRAAYGLFYDHPLLAIAFNSDIADAAQQQQFTTVLPGSPAPTATLNLLQIFQGTVAPGITPGVAASAQYLPGRLRFNDQTFPGFGPIFPFTLAVGQDFEYAYANQANITLERQLTKNTSVSASYIFVGAHHLPHPRDVNAPQNDLLVENFRRFAVGNPVICPAELGAARPACLANGRAPSSFAEAVLFPIPTASNALFTVRIPGLVAVNNVSGQTIVSPLAANFFRPNAPNYFFVQSVTGGAVTPAVFNAAIAGSVRTPGLISPFGDVSAQVSDGNSNYNAMTLEAKRRFSNNFQFLASYTWSHSIDDSSDLQTLLKPQDNRNFRAERSDSLFDQRHRFVFSGVATSPATWRGSDSAARRFFSDFTIAPILEISSGRPFNIITGTDANADLQSSNDRPSVAADGTLFVPPFLSTGNLRRNAGITHGYASLDLRVSRAIRFGERMRLDLIAEGFNLFNRFNEAAANPFFDVVNSFGERRGGLYYSRPTAAYDSRQFQFGFKFSF
ncbi:MAG TPA: TonB-dependent receptor [Pyrinomonadaceae bacterium]|nr:TonB-dependent receptor [Pyrinomonadaceae bacterium]